MSLTLNLNPLKKQRSDCYSELQGSENIIESQYFSTELSIAWNIWKLRLLESFLIIDTSGFFLLLYLREENLPSGLLLADALRLGMAWSQDQLFFFFFFFNLVFFRAAPMAYGSSEARGRIGAVSSQPLQCQIRAMSVTYTTVQSNAVS